MRSLPVYRRIRSDERAASMFDHMEPDSTCADRTNPALARLLLQSKICVAEEVPRI
jgi:hypothetical protein